VAAARLRARYVSASIAVIIVRVAVIIRNGAAACLTLQHTGKHSLFENPIPFKFVMKYRGIIEQDVKFSTWIIIVMC